MSYVRAAFGKIGSGLLYGIGFGIPVGAIYYFITEKQMDSVWGEQAADKVVVTHHEKASRGETISVLGTVENRGTQPARILNIQVDLYDKSGKFVDQCQEYVRGTLYAGESRNFKVSCGTKEEPIVEHKTYEVRVSGT